SLYKLAFRVVVSKDHKFANKKSISILDLFNEKLILYRRSLLRQKILSHLGKDFENNIIFYTENNETTKTLIELGIGISILPKFYTQKWSECNNVIFLEINDVDLSVNP